MKRYIVSGVTPIGMVAHTIKAEDADAAKAAFIRAHPKAVEINAVRAEVVE